MPKATLFGVEISQSRNYYDHRADCRGGRPAPALGRPTLLMLGIAAALCLASDAWAQSRPYRDNGRSYQGSEAMLRRAVAKASDCAVRQRHRLAVQFIVEDYAAGDTDRYRKRFFDWICLRDAVDGGVRLSMPDNMVRFAIAEALFRRDLFRADLPILTAVPSLHHPTLSSAEASMSDLRDGREISIAELRRRAAVSLSPYAECVVRTDWKLSRDLLRTRVETVEELESLRRLGPVFNSCAPMGAEFRLNKSWMRGAVANAYYRLAAAAGVVRSR